MEFKKENISFVKIINILYSRVNFILGVTLLLSVVSIIFIYFSTPQYRAETTILIDTRQHNILDGSSVLTGLTSDTSILESQVEIIKSRELLVNAANNLNLYDDGELIPKDNYFIKFIKNLFNIKNDDKINDKQYIISQMYKRLTVKRIGRTQVILIGYRSSNPKKAKTIVDAIAEAYLNDQLEAKLEATKRATNWLDNRISDIKLEIQEKEREITLFKQKNNLFSANGATTIEQQVSRLNEELILAKSDSAGKLAAYNQIKRLSLRGELQSYSGVLSSNVITNLRKQKSDIAGELSDLSLRYGSKHPKLQNIKSRMHNIERQINAEAKRILSNAKSEYKIAKSRERSLASSLSRLKIKLSEMGGHNTKLKELESEAEIARSSFDVISQRFKQTDKSEAIQKSDARVISKAEIPISPVFPKVKLILFLSILLGFIIGCVFVLISELNVIGFISPNEIEELLDISVIAKLTELDTKTLTISNDVKHLYQYIQAKPLSYLAEEIRKIRVKLEKKLDNKSAILVTSSVPNEGKTEIASSYAVSNCLAGKKVILLDCDFRNPSLSKMFNLDINKGLKEYIEDDITYEEVISKNVILDIDFIGISSSIENHVDLFLSYKFKELISDLKKDYDLIIIDTPPLMPVIDGSVICDNADHILYIVAHRQTPKQVVIDSLKTLKDKSKDLDIIFNRINVKKSLVSGGDYGYLYNNYSNYYEN